MSNEVKWMKKVNFFFRNQTSPVKLASERMEPKTLRKAKFQGSKPTPPYQSKWVV